MAKTIKVNARNDKLLKQAKRYLVGGVNSPVRSFNYVGGEAVLIKEGRGAKVYDYDGNGYIDYVLSWGSAILGHAHPKVVKAVKKAVDKGSSFGATNKSEIELAKAITDAIPFIDKLRFVSSGTEAVMGAVRLARGFTGRDKLMKFENAYHGHADYLLASAGSGLATLGIPSSAGVPKNFLKDTFIVKPADGNAIEELFKKRGKEIAAVIVEPVGGNYGVIPPDVGALKKLRRITKKFGALLIFDEVITGFRFNYGSFAREIGIAPDIICLGKIIGGGLPIGAYGGRSAIMNRLAPLGDVYQASTFSGNPVVMESGLSTLKELKSSRGTYEKSEMLAKHLIMNILAEAAGHKVAVKINLYKNMFSLRFEDKAIFKKFYRRLLAKGIYLTPSEFEANFVSLAHTKKDIAETIRAVKSALEGP